VTYNVVGFLDKNRDTLFTDLMQLCLDSQVPLLNEIFLAGTPGVEIEPGNAKFGKGAKKRPVTAGFQFKVQLNYRLRSYWRFYCNLVADDLDRLLPSCNRISNTISTIE
jgi:myosin heavy subunit